MARQSNKSPEELAAFELAKAEKFKSLASLRINNALKAIELLRGLANKAAYSYTPEQVEAIETAFDQKLTSVLGAFASGKIETKEAFSL